MNLYITSKQELEEVIKKAVTELFEMELPAIIRKINRKEWLNTEELMEMTGWSRRTLQYLRDKRRIPFSQEGRRILYPTDGIEEYLKSNLLRTRDR